MSAAEQILLQSIDNKLEEILKELRSHKHPADIQATATVRELHEAMIPSRHTEGWDESTKP